MPAVYKYPLNFEITPDSTSRGARATVMLPPDAQMLHIGLDPMGAKCLWALVDENAPCTEAHTFAIAGTGWILSTEALGWTYLVTLHEGADVFHVFEGPS